MSLQQVTTANIDPYPDLSGRELYETKTRTGLNRMPVILHLPRILGKTEDPEKDWALDDVATRLIVEGSLAAYDGELLDGLEEVTKKRVVQCAGINNEGKEVTRVFEADVSKTGTPTGKWRITNYADYDSDKPLELDSKTAPGSALWVFPNGKGLLYWASDILERIQRACETIEGQMSGAALKLIVLGFLGDWAKAREEFASGPGVVNIPTKGAAVQRVGSSELINHLLDELSMLRPNYMMLTYLTDTSMGANTSGEAWSIRLESMRYYVQQVQRQMRKIYSERFGVDLRFANYQVTSAQQRQFEFNLLQMMYQAGVITEEEFKAAARELMPS